MIEQKDKKYNSQFFEDCNTDWNLNNEFIHWLNYHLKRYLESASTIVDLEYRKFTYKNKEYTQKQIIEKLIRLTDEFLKDEWGYEQDDYKKQIEIVDEIFDLFHLVFWNMWW